MTKLQSSQSTPLVKPAHAESPFIEPIRLGVLGLGRAFTLMLPTLENDPRIRLVVAFDPQAHACKAFETQFGRTLNSARALCADAEIDWVYIATPHQFHVEHVKLAAQFGKHVLVEKPMALTLQDCSEMIDACSQANVHLIIGPSHSYDAPVLLARNIIASGELGAIKMLHAFNYTDFLYRPRRPEELSTEQGGGVIFSQGAHQIDVLRFLTGGLCKSIRAHTGQWHANRPTEGAYSALLQFDDGKNGDVFASAIYNGYGYYDSDALMEWVGEMGNAKSALTHANTHTKHQASKDETAEAKAKAARNFGGTDYQPSQANPPTVAHQHFGFVLASCEKGDLRLTARGIEIHDQNGMRFVAAPETSTPRQTVIDEVWNVAKLGANPLHSGQWSRATLEVCLAILKSHKAQDDIQLHHQVSL
jgi:phthalate 4,5-cis-dihydrodiol dehydrogenase